VVGVLIRMRWRVLRHSLRGRDAVLTVLGLVVGLCAAALTLVVAAAPFDDPRLGADVLAAVYLLWTIGWLFAPVLSGGGDETLRPEHFALLPVPPRRLAGGLLGAAFVGVPAIVTGVATLGLLLHADGAHLLVAVAAVPLQLVFVVLLSRVVMAGLGAVLRTRRGRDLGILLTAVVGMSGFLVQALVRALGPELASGGSPVLTAVLRWSPSGWGTVAVTSSWPVALACLAGLAALNAALLALWGVLLVRRTSSAGAVVTQERRRSSGRGLLPTTPVGAVVGKELRTWARDARRRVAVLSTVLVGVLMSVGAMLSGAGAPSPYGGLALVVFGCLTAGNLYGMDGSALWHTLVAPGAERVDVRGRQIAWLLVVTPFAVLLAVVLPAVSDPATYPWVLGLQPALLGGGAGIVVLLSVVTAYPMPDQKASPFATGGSPGLLRLLVQVGITLLLAVVALPVVAVVLAGELTGLPAVSWLGVPVGVVVGAVLFWWWGALAGRRLAARGPEVLAVVAKRV
jgi:ABC-2 type transport system permease protein